MSAEVKIIEKKDISNDVVMLFGFPDVGLFGMIAASHLISELNLNEVAYMDSSLLPPLIVLHEGLPHSSIRVFGNHNIISRALSVSAFVLRIVMENLNNELCQNLETVYR